MPRARSVAIALSAAALAVPSAAFGQGTSGAGDDQYEDPFDNGGNTPTQTTTGSQAGDDTLTQDPDLGGSPASSGSSSGTTTTPATSGTTTGSLPNTGSDPRLLILAGLALLLSGLGLRLRTADEIF
jgi:LPXTG-motif cell wall-anchored protein